MTYNPAQVRTWDLTSDNDGTVLNSEFARVYQNISEMMLGIAKSVDYTILAADKAGLVRVTNANTKETTKAFSAATPSVVSDVAHGLVTGDTIVVSGSTVAGEIGNIHYTVTRINDDTFSLDGTVNAGGGGGNLDWRKDVTITLPAAADTDNIYTVMKVDANEGAVMITDGSTDYFLYGQYDSIKFKSDGTNWIHVDPLLRGGVSQVRSQVVTEYVIADIGIDIQAKLDAVGVVASDVAITQLPQNTVEILLYIKFSDVVGGTTISMDFSQSGTNRQNIGLTATPTGATLVLEGTYWLRTSEAANSGNVLRAKKNGANTTVNIARVIGYKVKR